MQNPEVFCCPKKCIKNLEITYIRHKNKKKENINNYVRLHTHTKNSPKNVKGLQHPHTKLVCGLQQLMKIINRYYIETTNSLKGQCHENFVLTETLGV